MRGSVYKRVSTWTWVLDVGVDPVTGKRRQRTKGGYRTKRDAELALREVHAQRAAGTFVEPSRVTLAAFVEQWLAHLVVIGRAPRTVERYRELLRLHVLPELGRVPVQALTTLEVQRLYAHLLTSGRKDGRPGGLSRTTVGHVHRALHRALEQAVRWRLLSRNVVRDAELPPGERAAMVTLDREQAQRLRAAAEGSTLEVLVALGLATGARRGELLALRWADVDLDAGVVRIERSLQLVDGKLHVKLPKSEAGKRLVPLPRSTVGELRRHRAAQTERRLMIGPRYDTAADLVIAKADGAPFRPDYVSAAFRALVRRAGLPAAVHVHTLRHTVGSWLADAGVPPHDIAAILGHRDAGFTLRTYVHSLPDALRRAADTPDDALGGRP